MAVFKGRKTNPRSVEVRSVACEGGELDATLKELNAEGWNIRQVYHEPPTHYRVFAQRETPLDV
jgi:hypothetical protein